MLIVAGGRTKLRRSIRGVGFHVPRAGSGLVGQDIMPGSGWGEGGQRCAAGKDELGVGGVLLQV
jgi:hypothetical protein